MLTGLERFARTYHFCFASFQITFDELGPVGSNLLFATSLARLISLDLPLDKVRLTKVTTRALSAPDCALLDLGPAISRPLPARHLFHQYEDKIASWDPSFVTLCDGV